MEELICDICGKSYPEDSGRVLDNQRLCPDCVNEHTRECEGCGEHIFIDDLINGYCEPCYNNTFTHCTYCNDIIRYDRACYLADDRYFESPYCDQCVSEVQEAIHGYYYKPSPIFYGTGTRYYGCELEIDGGGEDCENASSILKCGNEQKEHLYIKHDGSLDDGMEIVTHPMTLDYHTNAMPWKEVLSKAISLGYRSHQACTCGLHVHVNRNAFGDTEEQQDDAIARILFFIERHWNELLKFSRRTQHQAKRWADRYGIYDKPKETLIIAKESNVGRYVALNLNNQSTIEFRIFRGTLKYTTFIATLQLVDEICNAAFLLSDDDFDAMTWSEFVSKIPSTKQELINYLKSRMLYVNEHQTEEEEI